MQARIFISHFGRRTASFSLATAAVLRDCQATAVQPRQPPDTSVKGFSLGDAAGFGDDERGEAVCVKGIATSV
jgi:hypothetical protein